MEVEDEIVDGFHSENEENNEINPNSFTLKKSDFEIEKIISIL